MAGEEPRPDVVILCGGFGTRLRPAVSDRPKPMALIQGRPFLEILVDYVGRFGFRRFLFCVHYRAQLIRDHFKDYRGLQVEFSEEEEPLGTAGALKACERRIQTPVFLVLNGDSYCEVDLARLHSFLLEKRGLGALTLVPAHPSSDGGLVEATEDGRIKGFVEKGQPSEGKLLSAGVYCFDRRFLEQIPAGRPLSLERDVFPTLVGRGLWGFFASRKLFDIGTPERLALFQFAYHASERDGKIA